MHARTAIGTKLYVAPEVVKGAPYDARADIYSLGLVLYQLTNHGYLPFFHANLPRSEWDRAATRRLEGEELSAPSEADEAFGRIILRACAPEPAQRFASAQEMYDALMEIEHPVIIQPKQQTAVQFWQEKPEKNDWLGGIGLVVTPSFEMRYMARRMLGISPEKNVSGGVLTPRTAARLPAWRIRASWLPCNKLEVSEYASIGDRAFRDRRDLTSVRCGKSVRSIGMNAFSGCSNIGELTCESGLEQILDDAFCDCVRLTRCHLPDTVYLIGKGVFSGCKALTSFRVPEGVQVLGDRTFDKCTALRQVTLPSALRNIGQAAFRGTGLQKLLLPDSCLRLGDSAFAKCRQLKSVQASFRMAVIPKSCFSGCTSLTQIVFPLRLKEIRERAFFGCTALTDVVIPEGTQTIGDKAFAGCENLVNIRVPDSVQQIGEEAFGPGGFLRGHFGKFAVSARYGSYAWDYCKKNGIRVKEP